MTKTCSKCNRTKESHLFHKNRAQPDGLAVYCKTCKTALDRKNGYRYNYKSKRKISYRFNYGKRLAKKRGLGWSLSLKMYESLMAQPCYYCQGPLPETCVGLDRIINTRGYHKYNVVPCCKMCNHIKRDFFNKDQMKEIGLLIERWRIDGYLD